MLVAGRWAIKVPSFRSYGHGARGVLWSITRGISANLSELVRVPRGVPGPVVTGWAVVAARWCRTSVACPEPTNMDNTWGDSILDRLGEPLLCELCKRPTSPDQLRETRIPGAYVQEWDMIVHRVVWVCPDCPG